MLSNITCFDTSPCGGPFYVTVLSPTEFEAIHTDVLFCYLPQLRKGNNHDSSNYRIATIKFWK